MTHRYLFHDNGLFLFEPDNYRVYRLTGNRRIEVKDPAAYARLRLNAIEIPENQAMRLLMDSVDGATGSNCSR